MAVPFLETPVFPDDLSVWANGGVGYKTTVIAYGGGWESRYSWWTYSKARWDLQNVLRAFGQANPGADAQAGSLTRLRNIFRTMKGQAYAFRFRDWSDFTDEGAGVLGASGHGSGVATYQMFKNYQPAGSGLAADQRLIAKPRAAASQIITDPATVVYKNGVVVPFGTSSGQCTVDYTTGLVTFYGTLPTSGDTITWAGTFDTPCRFETDNFISVYGNDGLYTIQNLSITEVRLG